MTRRALLILALCGALAAVSVYLGWRSAPPPAAAVAPIADSTPTAVEPPPARATAPASPPADTAPREATLVAALARLRPIVAQEAPAIAPALEALLSPESEAREEAVRTVGFADDARLVPPIVFLLLNDPAPAVRAAAAGALDIHDASPEASRALVRALEDPVEEVRAGALLSLKAHRNEAAEKELRRVLAAGRLPAAVQEEARLFLDRYYVRRDPLKDPLAP